MAAVVKTGGTAKPKQPRQAAVVDLESGTQAQGGRVDLDEDIEIARVIASLCVLLLHCILVAAGITIFMKISIWPAVGLTSFIASMIILIMIVVMSIRDRYIEKLMAENRGAPN
ncbi:hypothetical protein PVAP13_5KG560207 [Panicum virgatum]|uniref:Uncharacterized protein n=1 Tax=Panicum virgatum TaxID=38727 RepID=A0A8T0SXR0_PANVG|nr:hypothetical protein PVAP13_5KG513000 [Panicum virgatum]KAG2600960.1 hypothetical protein PVAP13_5KG560207 [Panicum virgatum]